MTPLLQVNDLQLTLNAPTGTLTLLTQLAFTIYPGEMVGLVGESGCGKSLTASVLLRLLPSSFHISGSLFFEGKDLLKIPYQELAGLRGNRLSLILQDPALALNPVLPIGLQLTEGLRYHKKISKKEAWQVGIAWLHRVGIGDAAYRMQQYPHELSGGMKQRLVIAMALICRPSLLIADEPTTALDVTIQAQILDLLQTLQQEEQTSILFITHDLGVVARCCQRVMVMYAGQIVEIGTVDQVLMAPQHPYTQMLLKSRRSLEQVNLTQPLETLEGTPPSLFRQKIGCSFASRCPFVMPICQQHSPPSIQLKEGIVNCWRSSTIQEAL